ncbi:Rcs stress response system protein RcsF [Shewanella maritima]|uniref:Rcs stress response system protein RcsF n=1 Tax=Shewanella maritima TaxID=2520507 RepID=UPI003736288C
MNISTPQLIAVCGLSLLLSACAGEYSFNSNLNGEAINEYFKPGEVTLYDQNNQPAKGYTILGLVEGSDCQVEANDVPASAAQARTEARKKAAEMGANGIIIQQCLQNDKPDDTCVSQSFCIGKAIKTQ